MGRYLGMFLFRQTLFGGILSILYIQDAVTVEISDEYAVRFQNVTDRQLIGCNSATYDRRQPSVTVVDQEQWYSVVMVTACVQM